MHRMFGRFTSGKRKFVFAGRSLIHSGSIRLLGSVGLGSKFVPSKNWNHEIEQCEAGSVFLVGGMSADDDVGLESLDASIAELVLEPAESVIERLMRAGVGLVQHHAAGTE